RLPRPRARTLRLLGDGLVSRARAAPGRRASPTGADSARASPAGAGHDAGTAGGADSQNGVRAATGRHGHRSRPGDRGGEACDFRATLMTVWRLGKIVRSVRLWADLGFGPLK